VHERVVHGLEPGGAAERALQLDSELVRQLAHEYASGALLSYES
jgi:hypothetical protein